MFPLLFVRKIKTGKYAWDSRFEGGGGGDDAEEDPYANLRDIVKGLLNIDAVERAQFITKIRNHAWFRMDPDFDWAKMANAHATPPYLPRPCGEEEQKLGGAQSCPVEGMDDDDDDAGQAHEVDWWPDGFAKI